MSMESAHCANNVSGNSVLTLHQFAATISSMIMRREKNDVRLSVSINKRLANYLEVLSNGSGFSQSEIVRKALEGYFKGMPKDPEALEEALNQILRRSFDL